MTSAAEPTQPASFEQPLGNHGGGPVGWGRWGRRHDLVNGAYVVAALAVLGALLGVIWQWWSPPGPIGYVVAPHAVQPDETEAFIAADGRFAVICAVAGLLAGGAAWTLRPTRGPLTAFALVVGALLGSLLTDVVGHVLAGGTGDGKTSTLLRELPLWVHMRGLLLLEAALAVLVYGLCASFAAEDDLGRPEHGLDSVGIRDEVHQGWRNRDAPGALEQPYLPPQ